MPDPFASGEAPAGLTTPAPLCILLVEDDEADAYLIHRALAGRPGVGRIVRAQDGVEAFRMVEDGEVAPDLAFIDLRMPRQDGFGLLAALASREAPGFPMVVLTSSTTPGDAVRSRLRGAVRVICKPAEPEQMEAELAGAVTWAQQRRARPGFASAVFSARFHGIPATALLIAREEEAEARSRRPPDPR